MLMIDIKHIEHIATHQVEWSYLVIVWLIRVDIERQYEIK